MSMSKTCFKSPWDIFCHFISIDSTVRLWIKRYTKWERVAKSSLKQFCTNCWNIVNILVLRIWNLICTGFRKDLHFLKMQPTLFFVAKTFVLSASLWKEGEPQFALSLFQKIYYFIQRWFFFFFVMVSNSCSWYCNSVEFYLKHNIKRIIFLRPAFNFLLDRSINGFFFFWAVTVSLRIIATSFAVVWSVEVWVISRVLIFSSV